MVNTFYAYELVYYIELLFENFKCLMGGLVWLRIEVKCVLIQQPIKYIELCVTKFVVIIRIYVFSTQ